MLIEEQLLCSRDLTLSGSIWTACVGSPIDSFASEFDDGTVMAPTSIIDMGLVKILAMALRNRGMQ
ncbi:unnamed protein product [Musa banksii]